MDAGQIWPGRTGHQGETLQLRAVSQGAPVPDAGEHHFMIIDAQNILALLFLRIIGVFTEPFPEIIDRNRRVSALEGRPERALARSLFYLGIERREGEILQVFMAGTNETCKSVA